MPASPTTLPQRAAVPVADTWDLHSIFSDDAAWGTEMTAIAADLPTLAEFRGRLGDSAATLADWYEQSAALVERLERAYVYASLQHETNTADGPAKTRNDRALGLYAQALATLSFAQPELLTIGFPTLRRWLTEEPRLAQYAHEFDRLERSQEHVRSAEVEELLGMVQDPFGTASATHGLLNDADMTFRPAVDQQSQEHTVAQGTIDALLGAPDRTLRRNAWESYADSHLAYQTTTANCLLAHLKSQIFLARTRRYGSAMEASLAANFIPTAVFDQLIATFKEHLPIWHRYWAVRQRALGQDDIAPYDIWAPLTPQPPRVSFDEGLAMITVGLAPLGSEYVEIVRRGVSEQRWVDKYPNVGKRAGAFSAGTQGTHPFILMNSANDLESMSTLAHELGHSLHSYYTWRTQPPVYANYSIFVAEVASNFNQALVRAHLFAQNPDRNFQLALINEAMSNFHRYFFLMPTLARFEQALYAQVEAGDSPSADDMNALLLGFFREAYGPAVTLDADRVGITWAQFATHLYSSFYVYQYATGLSGAHALAEGVLQQQPGAVERYLTFLSAGSSGYPLAVLKAAGVDLTTPAPVQQTFGVLSQLVDRLEALTTTN